MKVEAVCGVDFLAAKLLLTAKLLFFTLGYIAILFDL
jgi:hypothetical protein